MARLRHFTSREDFNPHSMRAAAVDAEVFDTRNSKAPLDQICNATHAVLDPQPCAPDPHLQSKTVFADHAGLITPWPRTDGVGADNSFCASGVSQSRQCIPPSAPGKMHRRRSGMSIAATVLVARWCAFVAADRGNAGWRWVIDERGRQDCSAHRRVQASARLLRIRRQSGSWSRIRESQHSARCDDFWLQTRASLRMLHFSSRGSFPMQL